MLSKNCDECVTVELFRSHCAGPGGQGLIQGILAGGEVSHAGDLIVDIGEEEVEECSHLRFLLHDLCITVDEERT